MMRRLLYNFLLCCLMMSLCSGCSQSRQKDAAVIDAPRPTVLALHADTPVIIDGYLNDSVWKNSTRYSLHAIQSSGNHANVPLAENAAFALAWDAQYVYLAVECDDSDIMTESTANGLAQYQLGDVCELFLKPKDKPQYVEFHINPAGYQTCYFWPSRGRRLPGSLLTEYPLRVAVQLRGTLNQAKDVDHGWVLEAAIPISFLQTHGMNWEPDARWSLLVGRYNYSLALPDTEYSAFPKLYRRDFHQTECYSDLIIIPLR